MLGWPLGLRIPMARLRRVAMTWGPLPVRTWEASSPKVTSRMWCRASMAQWPRIHPATWAGAAWWAARLALDADPDALMARLRELWSWWQANRPAAGRHHPPGGLGSHDN